MTSSLSKHCFTTPHCKGSNNIEDYNYINFLPTIKGSTKVDQRGNIFYFKAQNGISMFTSSNVWGVSSMRGKKILVRASSSPNDPSSSWQKWLLGLLLTVILPAVGYKGGLFSNLKSKIDKTIETVEHVAEVVEEVAEEAEKMAEEVEEKLPGDSKLKESLQSLDALAKRAVNEANKAEDAIHKVKDVEEDIEETLIKAGKAKAEK